MVPHWRIIQIGCLSQNSFWSEETPQRPQLCTITLIETDRRRMLVDPGFESLESARTLLDRRAGLQVEDIDTVLLTHFHASHARGLGYFENATRLMSRTEIHRAQKNSHSLETIAHWLNSIDPIEEHSPEGVEVIQTPGHTHGSASFLFETRDGMVVVAGDAVLTFDHFDARDPDGRAEDEYAARRAIDQIAKVGDVVIPGHDNYFVI
ncbi:MAG: MBL fold metallo-hydrolase [bacterium]|nr:MBL fold metallo-hydrolase [bacterium]